MKKRMTTVALASMMFAGSTLNIVYTDSGIDSEKTKSQLNDIRQNKKKLNEEVLNTQNEIDSVNSSINDITSKLNEVLDKKINNEKKLIEIQNKLDDEMTSLKNHLANYYMNSFNSDSSILENLIKSSSTSDFIVKSTYLKYAVDSKDEKVKIVENLLKEQENLLNTIRSNEDELVEVKESLLDKQAQLEDKKQRSKSALSVLSEKEAQLEDILIVQEKEEAEIKEQINNSNPSKENNITNISDKIEDKNDSNQVPDTDSNKENNSDKNVQNNIQNASDNVSNVSTNQISSKGFMIPVESYRFTSKFGYRTHPVTGEYKMHNGVDLAAAKGTVVRSAKSGEVVISKYSSSYGNYVVVNHEGGISTLYAHLDKRSVSVGDKVSMGDTIGLMGSTGMSTGPHLHLEFRVNGKQVDPALYIDIK